MHMITNSHLNDSNWETSVLVKCAATPLSYEFYFTKLVTI